MTRTRGPPGNESTAHKPRWRSQRIAASRITLDAYAERVTPSVATTESSDSDASVNQLADLAPPSKPKRGRPPKAKPRATMQVYSRTTDATVEMSIAASILLKIA